MKICSKKKDLLMVTMALMLLSSLSSILYTSPVLAQGQTIYVDPPVNIFYTNTTAVNSTFSINVTLRDAADVAGAQFRLGWNSSVLSCESFVLPSGHFMDPLGVEEAAGNLWILQNSFLCTKG